MKRKLITATLGMLITASAWANGSNAATDPQTESGSATTSALTSDNTAPQATVMQPADIKTLNNTDDAFQTMNNNLDKMRTLVDQMKNAKEDSDRHALLMQYMLLQHENMMIARNSLGLPPGPVGMAPGMGPGMMRGYGMGPGMGDRCDMHEAGMMRGVGGPAMMGGYGMMGPGMMRGYGMGPGMGMMGGGMGDRCDMHEAGMMRGYGMGPGMMRGYGNVPLQMDEALAARIQSLEDRLDSLESSLKK